MALYKSVYCYYYYYYYKSAIDTLSPSSDVTCVTLRTLTPAKSNAILDRPQHNCSEFRMQNLAVLLGPRITWPRPWKTVTGYPSNSESCLSYVCWCIKFIQDERHPIFTTASPHQPTSLRVLVYAPPAVDVTNGRARVWSLENVRFRVAGPTAWNSLPSSLHELTDTKTFKRQLKTFLFQQAYQ